ncbi:hypothetical protein BD779DRAFT_1521191 [Infundibulicybe gibba]|nr:hypothetical protein BD779DRAFT_1521191 [Infundibulicybe gibba]
MDDDPWANAWGEASKPVPEQSLDPNPSWQDPPNSIFKENQEADIGLPSWSVGADIKWTEPSDTQEESLWNQPPSTFLEQEEISEPVPVIHVQSVPPSPQEVQPMALAEVALAENHFDTTPNSPDAFGSFEVGLDSEETQMDPWTPSQQNVSSELNGDSWGGGWGQSDVRDEDAESSQPDEWENAKIQKEKQDRHVAPELLASILDQFNELSQELWPQPDQGDSHEPRSVEADRPLGLDFAAAGLVPDDLTLPQLIPFPKSFMSKRLGDTLRLTRHSPLTRMSPMALYLASKGSTAWEASVKSRPEVVQDDVLPPGWRIVEKDETAAPVIDKKKPSGGLLSFFGRKTSTPPIDNKRESPASPIAKSPVVSTHVDAARATPRSSIDSLKPPSITDVRFSAADDTAAIVNPPATSSVPAPAAPMSVSVPQHEQVQEQQPPPSAVSRFLNRFSRTKTSNSNTRNSLALSSDDLEFLSDIVPSANDDIDESLQLKALSNMIGSSPLPQKLPAPLAPPPKAPPRLFRPAPQIAEEVIAPISPSQPEEFTPAFDEHTFSIPPPVTEPSFSSPPFSLSAEPPLFNSPPISPTTSDFSRTSISTPIRSNTPIDRSMAFNATIPRVTSRPHTPSTAPKRTVTAIMSSGPVPKAPVIIPKLNATFSFPPPPTPSQVASPTATTSPVSTTSSRSVATPRNSTTLSSQHEFSLFDTHDHLLDFNNSPQNTASPPKQSTSMGDLSFSSASSKNGLFTSASDGFDDFDDFVSSPLRTPSPPRPPAKPQSFQHRPPPTAAPLTKLQITSPPKHQPLVVRRASRAADHQRTLSLVETAASRPGRWPAPPSPLPEAIPPPLNGPPGPPPSINGGSQRTMASPPPLLPAMASARLSPPVAPTPAKQTQPALLPSFLSPPATASKAPPGGLSAQDLSFFEGL